jgi:[acyl-carrier-protein] S-malonyltransferase
MGADLQRRSAHARRLFELADEVTGLPISRLCAEGPLDRLTQTDVAQPAVITTSLAALAVLREELGMQADAVAGHSVGEIAAYAAAGALEETDALRFVHARAQAMAAACQQVDGGMSAVLGLDEDALRGVCVQATVNGSSVELANLNAPGQLIVSGARDALDRLADVAKTAGARRVMPLNVGGPFHSVYMRPAAEALSSAILATTFQTARMPVVLNASARDSRDVADLQQELAVQVYSPVRWIESLQRLAVLGCGAFVEVGPGNVLTGLVRRTLPEVRAVSFGSMGDLDNVKAALA